MVSVQRFRGKLGGRQGTFVLQGSEIIENGKIKATWFVIPGSGTSDLSGLRGEGGFEGQFGKGSDGTWVIGLNDVATICFFFKRARYRALFLLPLLLP